MENTEIKEIDGGSGDAKRTGSHETKAESYLELSREEKNPVNRDKLLKKALKEMKKALKQDEFSWTAQNVAGRVMKETGKVEAALVHFCRALAIRPGNKEIRRDFNYCRSLKEATPAKRRTSQPFDLAELEERSRNGSVTAQQAIRKIQLKSVVEELWQRFEREGRPRNEPEIGVALIEAMYLYYAEPSVFVFHYPTDEEPHWEKFLDAMLSAHGNEKSDLDRKIRLCFGNVSRSDEHFRVQVVLEALRRYPEEIALYRLLHAVVVTNVDMDFSKVLKDGNDTSFMRHKLVSPTHWDLSRLDVNEGPDYFKKALLHAPDDLQLLFGLACTTSVRNSMCKDPFFEEVIEMLQRVADESPEDHELVPRAYYYSANCYCMISHIIMEERLDKAKRSSDGRKLLATLRIRILEFFKKGKAAEEKLLSHYLPLECFEKTFVAHFLHPFAEPDLEKEEETRADLVKSHRQLVKDKRDEIKVKVVSKGEDGCGISADLDKFKLPSMDVSSCQHLTPIKLSEMCFSKDGDGTFPGRILHLTLVEDPVLLEIAHEFFCVRAIAKDESGEAVRLDVYNLPGGLDYESLLGFGSKFSVTNPSLGVDLDGEVAIEVEKPDVSLIDNGKVEDMCRYCGRQNASNTCARCKWARYCSKECQKGDWKELGHKLICSSEKTQRKSFVLIKI